MNHYSGLISIVVPIYNVASYLERCVNSLTAQTYKNIEIILVDDGSTDGSEELCERLSIKDKRIRVLHQANGGVTKARKSGVAVAKGEYVGYVDPDDWVEPEMYESMFKTMIIEDVDIVCDGMKRENDAGIYSIWPGANYPCGIYKNESLLKLKKTLIENGSIRISGSMANKLFKKCILWECLRSLDERMCGVGDDVACVVPYILKASGIAIIDNAYYHGYDRLDSAVHSQHDTWYEQSNLLYICLKKAIEAYSDNVELLAGLKQFWLKEILSGLNNYYPDTYDFRFPIEIKDDEKCSIVLYGAGCVGRNYYKQLSRNDNVDIVLWVDENYKSKSLEDISVDPIWKIKEVKFDYIIVAINNQDIADEIKKELVQSYGVRKDIVIWEKPISFWDYCVEKQVVLV